MWNQRGETILNTKKDDEGKCKLHHDKLRAITMETRQKNRTRTFSTGKEINAKINT